MSINLTFYDFDVEGFSGLDCQDYDSLTIYNLVLSNSLKVGIFCNEENPPNTIMLLTGNETRLIFEEKGAANNTGFKIGYKAVKLGRENIFRNCEIFLFCL